MKTQFDFLADDVADAAYFLDRPIEELALATAQAKSKKEIRVLCKEAGLRGAPSAEALAAALVEVGGLFRRVWLAADALLEPLGLPRWDAERMIDAHVNLAVPLLTSLREERLRAKGARI